jgi:hypothetical protein
MTDLFAYARSFHKAAKTLAEALGPDSGRFTECDVSPVVFLYRHALELYLKALVLGDGGAFLATRPDELSILKTHSVIWLAQFISQIITRLKWEKDFRCDGIASLADFKAFMEKVNEVDPSSMFFRIPIGTEGQNSAAGGGRLTIGEFTRRMEALLVLLDSIAGSLTAERDKRSKSARIELAWNTGGVEPPIQ